jgi:hypothetical protein
MNDQAGRHVVVACDEASIKVLTMLGKSASYSTRNYYCPRNYRNYPLLCLQVVRLDIEFTFC